MLPEPPSSTRTDTLLPYTPLSRSKAEAQDLAAREQRRGFWIVGVGDRDPRLVREIAEKAVQLVEALVVEADVGDHRDIGAIERDRPVAFVDLADVGGRVADGKSEEHTYELQSLMGSSDAGVCFKQTSQLMK